MDIKLMKTKLIDEAKRNGFYPANENTFVSLIPDIDVVIYITDYGITFNGGINVLIRTFDYIQNGYSKNPNFEQEFFNKVIKYFKEV